MSRHREHPRCFANRSTTPHLREYGHTRVVGGGDAQSGHAPKRDEERISRAWPRSEELSRSRPSASAALLSSQSEWKHAGSQHSGGCRQTSCLTGPAWYLKRQQTKPVIAATEDEATYSSDTFLRALESSLLKQRVRTTLRELMNSADELGRTAISGRCVAAKLGIREATVSSHLAKARDSGFLLTKYRYNNSPLQQLTWPGSSIHPPRSDVSPLTSRIWSDGEVAWWTSLRTEWPLPPPWGSGEPPF